MFKLLCALYVHGSTQKWGCGLFYWMLQWTILWYIYPDIQLAVGSLRLILMVACFMDLILFCANNEMGVGETSARRLRVGWQLYLTWQLLQLVFNFQLNIKKKSNNSATVIIDLIGTINVYRKPSTDLI